MQTRTEEEVRDRLAQLKRAKWEADCRSDLTAWTMEALRPVRQTPARHHRLLLQHLEKVAHGKIDRLMVLMPPGHAKSLYCSVLFPAWMFAQKSHLDMLGTSHGSDLAEEFSGKIQRYVEQHQALLGYGLASHNVKSWRTTNGGFYRAVGVGGSLTGRRGDGAIIDDPVKDMIDAESPIVQEHTIEWYRAVLNTRLKPDAWIILIMTRWNEKDLGGQLLLDEIAGGDKWTILKLPAICDSIDDPLHRKIGEALWPEMYNEEVLARKRAVSQEYIWGALYQQDPKPRTASFFQLESLLVKGPLIDSEGKPVFIPVPMPAKTDTIFAVIDTAIKSGQEHNSTAVAWISYNSLTPPATTLIVDWDITQIEGAHQEAWLPSVHARGEELARLCGARHGYSGAMIEDKATGTVLIQQSENQARREGKRSLGRAIDSALTAMGKEERAIAAAPYVEAGMIKLTEHAFNKTKIHKGKSANHFLVQVTDFRLGAKQKDGLDLLDTFCYSVLLTCGVNFGDRKGI